MSVQPPRIYTRSPGSANLPTPEFRYSLSGRNAPTL